MSVETSKMIDRAKRYERTILDQKLKPALAGLLYELVETLAEIPLQKRPYGNTPYTLFAHEKVDIHNFGLHDGMRGVHPAEYVEARIESIEDATLLLNRIKEIEEIEGIKLTGKYKTKFVTELAAIAEGKVSRKP